MIDEYYCPNCGAILNEQEGFDPSLKYWQCDECGEFLYGDDVYQGESFPGVMWLCDECGDLLNGQDGFRDIYGTYICKKCGHLNMIDDSQIINVEKETDDKSADPDSYNDTNDYNFYSSSDDNESDNYSSNDDDDSDDYDSYDDDASEDGEDSDDDSYDYYDDDDSDDYDSDSDDSSGYEYTGSYSYPHQETAKKKGGIKSFFKKLLIVLVLALIISCGGLYAYARYLKIHEGQVKIGYSSSELSKFNYRDLLKYVKKLGFKKITINKIDDLSSLGIFTKNGDTEKIFINGIDEFDADDWFDLNDQIIIEYHSIKQNEKDGFNSEDKAIDVNSILVNIPSYFTLETEDENSSVFITDKKRNGILEIAAADDISYYDNILRDILNKKIGQYSNTFLLSDESSGDSSPISRKISFLGERSAINYTIYSTAIYLSENNTLAVITLCQTDDSKNSFVNDYVKVVDSVSAIRESDIKSLYTSKELKGKDVEEVAALLSQNGFSSITKNPMNDIVIGLLSKNGSVDSITINGEVLIKDAWYSKDAEIVIKYHSKKE